MVTSVPPVDGPEVTLSPVTAGGEKYVKLLLFKFGVDVPLGVSTDTLTPVTFAVGAPDGLIALMAESDNTRKVAPVAPKSTLVVPLKPEPLISTTVPPAPG